MTTRAAHYREAERLLEAARQQGRNGYSNAVTLAEAQVHATLSTVDLKVEHEAYG